VLQCVAGCVYAIELVLQTKLPRQHFCKTVCPARAFVHRDSTKQGSFAKRARPMCIYSKICRCMLIRVWRMCVCDEVCCGVFQYVAECCSCNIFCSIYTYIVCLHVHTCVTRVTLYGRCSTFQKFCATDYYAAKRNSAQQTITQKFCATDYLLYKVTIHAHTHLLYKVTIHATDYYAERRGLRDGISQETHV